MILKLNVKRAGNHNDLYGVNGNYPYLKYNVEIPVELVQTTEHFITLKVLPHLCNSESAFDISKPYNISVDRLQLERKEIELW